MALGHKLICHCFFEPKWPGFIMGHIFHLNRLDFMIVCLRGKDWNFLKWFVLCWPEVGLTGWPLTFSITNTGQNKVQLLVCVQIFLLYLGTQNSQPLLVLYSLLYIIERFWKCWGYSSVNLMAPTQLFEVVCLLLMAFYYWLGMFSCLSKNLLDPVNCLKSVDSHFWIGISWP